MCVGELGDGNVLTGVAALLVCVACLLLGVTDWPEWGSTRSRIAVGLFGIASLVGGIYLSHGFPLLGVSYFLGGAAVLLAAVRGSRTGKHRRGLVARIVAWAQRRDT